MRGNVSLTAQLSPQMTSMEKAPAKTKTTTVPPQGVTPPPPKKHTKAGKSLKGVRKFHYSKTGERKRNAERERYREKERGRN